MQAQAEVSAARAQAQIGTVQDVIIDGLGDVEGTAIGRTKADAPEVDGVVHLTELGQAQPGDIISVNITDADDYDLFGSPA